MSEHIGTMRQFAVALLILLGLSQAQATWYLTFRTTPLTVTQMKELDSANYNQSGSAIDFVYTPEGIYYQRITGSADTGAPWTSPWNALSNSTYVYTGSQQTVNIPHLYSHRCQFKFSRETGAENWTNVLTPPQNSYSAGRNRSWDTLPQFYMKTAAGNWQGWDDN